MRGALVVGNDISGATIIRIAREWLGTPYRHQTSAKNHGTDCLGLIRGIWRELYGHEAEVPPPYTQDWCECSRDEPLWRAAQRWFFPGDWQKPGDVVLFRMSADAPAKHVAVRAEDEGEPTIIHAYSGRAVIESPFTESWRRRVVAAFRFPRRTL